MHRTIHKSKGDEFENVLLIIEGKNNAKFNENTALKFILSPNLEDDEDHRVYYVAMSRTKSRLFLNVPELLNDNEKKLKRLGFDVKRL